MRISSGVSSINGYKSKVCPGCGGNFTTLKRQFNFIYVCTNPVCSLKIILPIPNWKITTEKEPQFKKDIKETNKIQPVTKQF